MRNDRRLINGTRTTAVPMAGCAMAMSGSVVPEEDKGKQGTLGVLGELHPAQMPENCAPSVNSDTILQAQIIAFSLLTALTEEAVLSFLPAYHLCLPKTASTMDRGCKTRWQN